MAKNLPLKKTIKIFSQDAYLSDVFMFNEFSEDVEFYQVPEWDSKVEVGKILEDRDIVDLRFYVSKVHDFEPQKNVMGDACYLSARLRSYHPVKDYIQAVKWDNMPRIDEWLYKTVGCEDNCYTRQVAAKFLIATVARIYNPGCKFDYMMILEGSQGIGKSTLVEELAGNWFLDTNFSHKDKDLIDSMRGVFMVEISELSGMNKKDVDWLKSFLSKKVDRVRLPYAARSKDFKRKCVFVGTYNPSGNNMYLRDDTGNRRFWPIECGERLNVAYVRENKGQLWAEALTRFKTGEKYHIEDPVALSILDEMHGERELESPTHNMIKRWLVGKPVHVSMEDIITDCLKTDMIRKSPRELLSMATTIGIIMRKLKWRKGTNECRNIYYRPAEELTELAQANAQPDTPGPEAEGWDE